MWWCNLTTAKASETVIDARFLSRVTFLGIPSNSSRLDFGRFLAIFRSLRHKWRRSAGWKSCVRERAGGARFREARCCGRSWTVPGVSRRVDFICRHGFTLRASSGNFDASPHFVLLSPAQGDARAGASFAIFGADGTILHSDYDGEDSMTWGELADDLDADAARTGGPCHLHLVPGSPLQVGGAPAAAGAAQTGNPTIGATPAAVLASGASAAQAPAVAASPAPAAAAAAPAAAAVAAPAPAAPAAAAAASGAAAAPQQQPPQGLTASQNRMRKGKQPAVDDAAASPRTAATSDSACTDAAAGQHRDKRRRSSAGGAGPRQKASDQGGAGAGPSSRSAAGASPVSAGPSQAPLAARFPMPSETVWCAASLHE